MIIRVFVHGIELDDYGFPYSIIIGTPRELAIKFPRLEEYLYWQFDDPGAPVDMDEKIEIQRDDSLIPNIKYWVSDEHQVYAH